MSSHQVQMHAERLGRCCSVAFAPPPIRCSERFTNERLAPRINDAVARRMRCRLGHAGPKSAGGGRQAIDRKRSRTNIRRLHQCSSKSELWGSSLEGGGKIGGWGVAQTLAGVGLPRLEFGRISVPLAPLGANIWPRRFTSSHRFSFKPPSSRMQSPTKFRRPSSLDFGPAPPPLIDAQWIFPAAGPPTAPKFGALRLNLGRPKAARFSPMPWVGLLPPPSCRPLVALDPSGIPNPCR